MRAGIDIALCPEVIELSQEEKTFLDLVIAELAIIFSLKRLLEVCCSITIVEISLMRASRWCTIGVWNDLAVPVLHISCSWLVTHCAIVHAQNIARTFSNTYSLLWHATLHLQIRRISHLCVHFGKLVRLWYLRR